MIFSPEETGYRAGLNDLCSLGRCYPRYRRSEDFTAWLIGWRRGQDELFQQRPELALLTPAAAAQRKENLAKGERVASALDGFVERQQTRLEKRERWRAPLPVHRVVRRTA